jgi:hypothetical protein
MIAGGGGAEDCSRTREAMHGEGCTQRFEEI